MTIRVKIVPKDISTVAKIVLIDESNRALFLKRSYKNDKYPGQWDLPGGHLMENESILDGLFREILEETSLTVKEAVFVTKIENTHFFMAKYDSQPIKLSKEHTAYSFISRKNIKGKDKFEKVALMVMGDER
jgi:8-oxo-dGTP diphosphatase|tara:strand:- start:1478 stop:1873 length:396 start_codon:yes stop_codon:yes gene_type:complete